MTNVKTPKNSKDLKNLDGEAGMTKEEWEAIDAELDRRCPYKGKVRLPEKPYEDKSIKKK